MAKTPDGIEFYLIEVSATDEHILADQVEAVSKSLIRAGDGVLRFGDRVFIAAVTGVPGAAKAARRLLGALKDMGLETRVRLLAEPFAEEAQGAAEAVDKEQVKIKARTEVQWE